MSPKVAYLIIAHANHRHFGRLVRALTTPSSACFVHIDAKTPIEPFQREAADQAVFCTERHRVYWGEFSIVRATLAALDAALNDPRGFDYFVLLSGADYPIAPQEQITGFLHANAGAEFMNLVAMPSEAVDKKLDRLTRYKVASGRWLTAPEKGLRRAMKYVPFIPKARNISRGLDGLAPFAGSQWWALTRASCERVTQFLQERPKVVRFYENSWYADEGFFQTIVANSPRRQAIRHNLTFTDWGAGGAHPAQVDKSLIELLSQPRVLVQDAYGDGEVFFARKFDDASGPVLDALDAAIARKRALGWSAPMTDAEPPRAGGPGIG